MKNSKSGFIFPLLLGIIAIIAISGGSYVFLNQNKHTEPIQTNEDTKSLTTSRNLNDISTTSIKNIQSDKNTDTQKIIPTNTKPVSPVTSNKNSLSYSIEDSTLKIYWKGELTQILSV